MHQLPIFLNLAGVPVLILGDGEAAAAKARLVERAGGRVVAGLAEGPRIAFVALEDDDDAAAAAAQLRAAGLLVNVVDRPALCDFTTPAIIDRAPMTIAIGTGGASAGAAKALRQRLEALIPEGLGRLAAALSAARGALRTRYPDKDEPRFSPAARLTLWARAVKAAARRWTCGLRTGRTTPRRREPW
jgi:uroporphyrin-III C-methyltransferase / precorrin-2 dehydrogenase / sirohydrochlorin ferrochelatase